MSWPVRSRLLAFYVATPPGGTWVVLGTVPAGKTWLVKQWTAYNGGGGVRDILLGMRQGAVDCIIQKGAAVPSAAVTGTAGLSAVFPAGTQLMFWSSTATPIQLHVSGAELG
jgi:hypothetical protein